MHAYKDWRGFSPSILPSPPPALPRPPPFPAPLPPPRRYLLVYLVAVTPVREKIRLHTNRILVANISNKERVYKQLTDIYKVYNYSSKVKLESLVASVHRYVRTILGSNFTSRQHNFSHKKPNFSPRSTPKLFATYIHILDPRGTTNDVCTVTVIS